MKLERRVQIKNPKAIPVGVIFCTDRYIFPSKPVTDSENFISRMNCGEVIPLLLLVKIIARMAPNIRRQLRATMSAPENNSKRLLNARAYIPRTRI